MKKTMKNKLQHTFNDTCELCGDITVDAPIVIDEKNMEGHYYCDGSGEFFIRLNKRDCFTNWWEPTNWGVEDGGIDGQIEYLEDDIDTAKKQMQLMQQALKLLKQNAKKLK